MFTNSLSLTRETEGLALLPVSERDLPTAMAEPYFKVSDAPWALEGAAFDRQGNLLFVDIFGGQILCLTPSRKMIQIYYEANLHPAGLAIHRDGRIYIAALGPVGPSGQFENGQVISIEPDGVNRAVEVAPELGYVPDDLVFDSVGGFYFTDMRGASTDPAGGVFYVSPDRERIVPVLPRMCAANGVALSPDGKVLWATECCSNRLHRVDLEQDGVVARYGAGVPYHFVGRHPDSMRTDSAGNVYVAMYMQARVLVFSPAGMPIGQILLPGRENGHFLKSTSLAIKPSSKELFIVARDELNGLGAMVFVANGFSEGFRMFSHQ